MVAVVTIGLWWFTRSRSHLSQPPGVAQGGFRVTEQGETIRYKFGMPILAQRSLNMLRQRYYRRAYFTPTCATRKEMAQSDQQTCRRTDGTTTGQISNAMILILYLTFGSLHLSKSWANLP